MERRLYKINYITHLNRVSQMLTEDNRLTAWHISLYYALFHLWNANNFNNPFLIHRIEIMKAAKIGSLNTYHKGLHQLQEWSYIAYFPSYNSFNGSRVHMFIFDTTLSTTNKRTRDRGTKSATGQQVSPIIKRKETTNKVLKTKKSTRQKTLFEPPTFEFIKDFFKENNTLEREAELFFHHYESVGWKSGKNNIQNWQALAKKWMINSQKFQAEKTGKIATNHLHAKPTNYEETL
jgi:hypothetical protein